MAVVTRCCTALVKQPWSLIRPNANRYLSSCRLHQSNDATAPTDSTFELLNAGGFATLLPERAVLRIEGKDTLTFLQGMTTNHLLSLQEENPPTAIFTMFLNAPGRVLADAILTPEHVSDESQSLLIDCHRDVADILRKHLKRFKLRSKFSLEDVSERYPLVSARRWLG